MSIKSIENEYIKTCDEYFVDPMNAGFPLCDFLTIVDNWKLSHEWDEIWDNTNKYAIWSYFYEKESMDYHKDVNILTYLTRCLSLHILLEDNKEYL